MLQASPCNLIGFTWKMRMDDHFPEVTFNWIAITSMALQSE